MVQLKDNVTFICILALTHSCSIIQIACNSLCQFECFNALCLKSACTIIDCRAYEHFNLRKLPQVA